MLLYYNILKVVEMAVVIVCTATQYTFDRQADCQTIVISLKAGSSGASRIGMVWVLGF